MIDQVANILANKSLNCQDSKQKSSDVRSDDPDVAKYNPPETVFCEYCGEPRYTKGLRLGGYVRWMPYGPERCKCPEAVKEYEKKEAERIAKEEAERKAEEASRLKDKIKEIIGESGMGTRFLRRTFETFQVTQKNKQAHNTVKNYTDNFESGLPKEGIEPGRNGLFIAGPAGTGKTHLAAAVANQLIQKGIPVICMTMIDLLGRIRKTYNQYGVDESSVLDIYKTVPLLIIDDMGKEPATDWAVSTIYNIVNGRYENYMPTIITTNYEDNTLINRLTPKSGDSITAEATIDRLKEMCIGVVVTGESWRLK